MRTRLVRELLPTASLAVIAAAMLAPGAASAQTGFQGSYAVAHGSAGVDRTVASVDTITPTAASTVTTINWTPSDTGVGGGAINFLPSTSTANFNSPTGSIQVYTVLNRILATDQSRVIAFNGVVNSSPNMRVWFYTPGGALIGPSAQFNVGGLVLSTADPVLDGTGNYLPSADHFSLTGRVGGTQSITVSVGARISATTTGQSNYVVLMAPQIAQNGTINVAGSTALVAAESATFAVDSRNLFTISVTAGSTVSTNTLTSTGTTGGPGSAANSASLLRRVYMVAVPKNNAVTMAIASGGALGFDIAGAASLQGDTIVLSAGKNVTDTGTPSFTAVSSATGTASISVTGGTSFSSNTILNATGAATVSGSNSFSSSLALSAPTATATVSGGTLSVGGDLSVTGLFGAAIVSTALVNADNGGMIRLGTNASLLSAGGASGALQVSVANDAEYNASAKLTLAGGSSLSTPGSVLVNANGFDTGGIGAAASINVSGGSTVTAGGFVSATANALAQAGSATIIASDAGTQIVSAIKDYGAITASATATASSSGGGDAIGGTALIRASNGAKIATTGVGGFISASASATGASLFSSAGGKGVGGTASVIADNGTIAVGPPDPSYTDHGAAVRVYADATGGASSFSSGDAGDAVGGTALIQTNGGAGQITVDPNGPVTTGTGLSGLLASATATGGTGGGHYSGGSGGNGGNATGGTATIAVTGSGQSITTIGAAVDAVQLSASATGGLVSGSTSYVGTGGSAQGGTVNLLAAGGTIDVKAATFSMAAGATGGASLNAAGGGAIAGTATLTASQGGTLQLTGTTSLTAAAVGGTGTTAGSGVGGEVLATNIGGTFQLDRAGGGITIGVDGTTTRGDALFSSVPGAATLLGPGTPPSDGSLTIADPVTITGNARVAFSAGSDLKLSGTIAGGGNGVRLALIADNTGTGAGTVTLAPASVSLTGTGTDIGVYYNPAGGLGVPDDFSAGIAHGSMLAFQLINSMNGLYQLSSLGTAPNPMLAQNFALSRDIDAMQNGINPIGTSAIPSYYPTGTVAAPFTGNFDGLGHTITDLQVYGYGFGAGGLFGVVGTAAHGVLIRDVGLIGEVVYGDGITGGLVGQVTAAGCATCTFTVDNSFTTGYVYGGTKVGGLVGQLDGAAAGLRSVTNSHSDAQVNGDGSVGGLAGETSFGRFQNDFATGTLYGGDNARGLGGLIGTADSVTVARGYAAGPIYGGSNDAGVGGLIGQLDANVAATGAFSTVSETYAVGTINLNSGTGVGGLVGTAAGAISQSYASGSVSGGSGTAIGGLVGQLSGTHATVATSYWDIYTTGQQSGVGATSGGATVTSLTPVEADAASQYGAAYAYDLSSYPNFSGDWLSIVGSTRPVGTWELPVRLFGQYTVASAHQVQLITENMGATYRIAHGIDLTGTTGINDIWNTDGFIPLGYSPECECGATPFTGTLLGNGKILSNLTMSGSASDGLFENNAGTISDLGLDNVSISAYSESIGGLAAVNSGTITDSFVTGSISGSSDGGYLGGLVGYNAAGGTISQSYATVAISANGLDIGGLVGYNAGTISGTYANGTLSTSGGAVGGLIGDNPGTVTTSYYDTTTTAMADACGSGDCTEVTGLTTDQTLHAANFAAFSIDTTGGQGLPWRQYEGQTTPLLSAFLRQVTLNDYDYEQYTAATQSANVTVYTPDNLIFGTGTTTATGRNVGTYTGDYDGGLYSIQRGYDLIAPSGTITLNITPAPLTLSAAGDSRTYNGTTGSTAGVTYEGLLGDDSVSGLSQSFDSRNVGTRTLSVNDGYTINDGNGGANYTVSTVTAEGRITPATLTLAATTDTRAYNGTTGSTAAPGTIGLVGGDTVTGLSQSFDSKNAGARTLTVNSGYTINDGNGGANYTVAVTGATGRITPATLTLAAASDTRTYNASQSSTATPIAIGLFGTDSVTGLSETFDSRNAGARTLSVGTGFSINDGNSGANYTITFATAAGRINPATLTLTAASDSRTYNATTSSTGTPTASGLVGTDSITGLSQTFDSRNAGARTLSVTGYTLNDGNGGANYTVVQNTAAGQITPAALTLGAVGDSRTYDGTASSAGTPTASGLVGTDSITGISQTFDSRNAGTRTLSVTGYTLNDGNGGANYTVSRTAAAGRITPATLTLAAVSDSRAYNGTTSSALTPTAAGLATGDTVTGLSQAFDSRNVGARRLTVNSGFTINDGNGGANYTFTGTIAATGQITPATLTLTAATDTRTYNSTTTSTATPTVTGLFGTDSVTGLSESFDSRNAGARTLTVGSGYTVNDGNSGLNYTVALASTAGRINPATLTLTAASDSRTYNATTSSTGTPTASGLVGTDSITGLSQTFDSRNAGARTLSVTGYTLNDGNGGANYTVVQNSAAGQIAPATLTLAATSDSRTYDGTTSSTASPTATGLIGTDSVSGLVEAFDSRNAGTRTLAVSGYTVNDGNGGRNYTVALTGAAGQITPAALTLTATSDNRAYNGTNSSTATPTVRGLVGTDSVAGLSEAFDSRNVGSRSLAVSGYTVNDGNGGANYVVSLAGAIGQITPAALIVTYSAAPATSIYGDTPATPSGTIVLTGLQGTDSAATVLSGTAAFATNVTAQSSVGSFAITGSGLASASANYQVSFAQGTGNASAYTITPRPITITADPQSTRSGTGGIPFTYTVTYTSTQPSTKPALVNGDVLTGALTSDTSGLPGVYAIRQGTLAASTNYRITYIGADFTVSQSDLGLSSLPTQVVQKDDGIDLPYVPDDPATPDPREAIERALAPIRWANTIVDVKPIARALPIHENVTTNGDSGQWQPPVAGR